MGRARMAGHEVVGVMARGCIRQWWERRGQGSVVAGGHGIGRCGTIGARCDDPGGRDRVRGAEEVWVLLSMQGIAVTIG